MPAQPGSQGLSTISPTGSGSSSSPRITRNSSCHWASSMRLSSLETGNGKSETNWKRMIVDMRFEGKGSGEHEVKSSNRKRPHRPRVGGKMTEQLTVCSPHILCFPPAAASRLPPARGPGGRRDAAAGGKQKGIESPRLAYQDR